MSNAAVGFGSVNEMTRWLEERQAAVRGAIAGVPKERVEDALVLVMSGLRDQMIRKPDLLRVEPTSILKAAMLCARMNLYPGNAQPDVYLTPRNEKGQNGWTKVLQAEPSWRGMLKLVQRAGVKSLRCRPVFIGEHFRSGENAQGSYLEHEEGLDVDESWDNLLACYLRGEVDGVLIHHLCRRPNIERHRAASDAFKGGGGRAASGPWIDHPIQMAQKTAIKDAVLRGTFPMPDEIREAALYEDIRVPDEREIPRVSRIEPRQIPQRHSLGLDEDAQIIEVSKEPASPSQG